MKTTIHAKPSSARIAVETAKAMLHKTQKFGDLMHLMAPQPEKGVTFEFRGKSGSRVFVAGTFNDWNPTSHPMEYHLEDDVYRATLLLDPGVYEYKFVVDGEWLEDSRCRDRVLNDQGSLNSVITI